MAFFLAALAMVLSGGLATAGAAATQSAHVHVSASPMPDDDDHDHLGSAGPALLALEAGQFDSKTLAHGFSPYWAVAPARANMLVPREFGAIQSIPPVDPPPPRALIRFA